MRVSTGYLLRAARHLVAAAVLGLSAGCTELSWHRAGADAAAIKGDLQHCRQHARAYSARFAWPFPDSGARLVATDRTGHLVVTPYPYRTGLENDRSVLESELVGECMRKKGYVLAPASTRARP